METFKIEVKEFLSQVIEVEAENIEEAISKVKTMYRDEEIILDYSDYIATEINVYKYV